MELDEATIEAIASYNKALKELTKGLKSLNDNQAIMYETLVEIKDDLKRRTVDEQ